MFKRKLTTSVQFTEEQMNWLGEKALELAHKEQRKVSVSEINRKVIQAQMDKEKEELS